MTPSIRCHYDVLDVPRDADERTIKKAHRKKALKYHPDKNFGDQDAAKEFQLIQQAYECLSDPQERKYYDEHRESILRGIKPGDEDDGDISYVFDVTPYHFTGCYDGYGDGVGGFFHTYRLVFHEIMKGEQNGWISEGNIDETKMPNHFLPTDFGDGSTPWKEVSNFYNSWEGFISCLSFAWVDTYDPRDAESRYVRRRIDDENRKVRKVAKRKRSDEIIELVAFVKKKDPRVIAARNKAQNDKHEKELRKKEEATKKKQAAAIAREEWKLQREADMREMEDEDLHAGRVRLADLDDDSDDSWYGHSNRKGKGKKKKGNKSKGKKKKKGNKNRQHWSSSEEEEEHDVATSTIDAEGDNASVDSAAEKTDEVMQQSEAMDISKDQDDEVESIEK
jgi:DnaJ family protein A protein 5